MSPQLVPGEQPLLVFVSSVMSEETNWAREAAEEALNAPTTLQPWLFEYTPPSSDGAVETYLEKVRECDIFVWLVTGETTEPVAKEVRLALELAKTLWVVLLPAEARDALTQELLDDVAKLVKYGHAATAEELRELLALTYDDEVIRAMRAKTKAQPEYTRLAYIESVGRRSRQRMVNRWTAAGLDASDAIAFADNPAVGVPPSKVVPSDENRLSILVADGGAGKSVVAERALQQAIVQAREWEGAPLPVFIHMRQAADGLEAVLRAETDGIADIRLEGVFAVVDGADEVPAEVTSRIVDEARELVVGLPQTRILITSRPTAALREIRECVSLPLLSPEDARLLVSQIAGYEVTIGMEGNWPPSVRDAIRRPLFAILLGRNRRLERPVPQTQGELLDSLVEEGIEAAAIVEFLPTLRRLAALVTDNGGPVEPATIGGLPERVATDASRLVREENGLLDFSLPLITQWFAAEALIAREVSVEELVTESPRLDRWRYALAIALSRGSREFVESAMTELVAAAPGFAAEIIEDSFTRWPPSSATHEPRSSLEAGASLRQAFEAWGEAIAPLDERLLPHRDDGSLPTLGAIAGDGRLTFGWYRGADLDDRVVELPGDINIFQQPSAWRIERYGQWADERGWEWRWALEILRNGLKSLVQDRALVSDHPALVEEAIWLLALLAGRQGSLSPGPVPFNEVEALIEQLDPERPLIRLNDRLASTESVLERLRELRESGVNEIYSPWPAPDRDLSAGGFIWDPYSPAQQLARTEAVYGSAVGAYADLVERWFPKLKSRMQIAVILPAVLRGRLVPSAAPPSHFGAGPTVFWHLDPLPLGEESRVELELVDRSAEPETLSQEEWRQRLEDRQAAIVTLRPEAAGWISIFEMHEVNDVFQGAPLAPLVYDWLKRDLAAIRWQ